jgi:hypothetical protein
MHNNCYCNVSLHVVAICLYIKLLLLS